MQRDFEGYLSYLKLLHSGLHNHDSLPGTA
jgi:hypothetical protein